MNTVTEALVSALRALPRDDKCKAFNLLLADADFRSAVAHLVNEKLLGTDEVSIDWPDLNGIRVDEIVSASREVSKRLRTAYISRLTSKGVKFDRVDNVWAKTHSGLWVALPFASERQSNRWFLGLGQKDLAEKNREGQVTIILLCQPKTGNLMDFVIPPYKVQALLPKLSSAKGQFKFNLRKVGHRYHLLLTGENPPDVTDYAGETSLLRD